MDLVNGKYSEQIEYLHELAKQKTNDYLITNKTAFDTAKKDLYRNNPQNFSNLLFWSNYSPKSADQKIIEDKLIDFSKNNSKVTLSNSKTQGTGDKVTSYSLNLKIDANDIETLDILQQLYNDLSNLDLSPSATKTYITPILEQISNTKNNIDTDALKQNKLIYDEYIKALILDNDSLSVLYSDSIKAVTNLNTAYSKGIGVDKAVNDLKNIQKLVSKSTDQIEGSQDVFENIFSSVNKNAKLGYDIDNIFRNNESVRNEALKIKDLTKTDLSNTNFNDDLVSDQEEALSNLLKSTGLGTDQLDILIDKLIEYGYVIDDTKELQPFENLTDTDVGERLANITSQFEAGKMSYADYFESLQSEIDNIDFSNYTSSLDEANALSKQFFTDSIQQSASGLSDLINKFDEGSIGISDYLDGYTAIGDTLNVLTDNLQENSSKWSENGEAIDSATSGVLDNYQNQLSDAIAEIDNFKDSCYSLNEILSGNIQPDSEEFSAHVNVISEDLARIVSDNGLMADEVKNRLGSTTDEIAENMMNSVTNQSFAAQVIAANTNSAIENMAGAVGNLFNVLGEQISHFKVDISFSPKKLTDSGVKFLGFPLPKIDYSIEANSDSFAAIGSAISTFGQTLSQNIDAQKIDLQDFYMSNDSKTSSSSNSNKSKKSLDSIKDGAKSAEDAVKKSSKGASDSVKNAAEEAKKALDELIKKFDELEKGHDLRLSLFTDRDDKIQDAIKLLESQGNLVGKAFYEELINSQNKQIQILTQKRSDLENYLNESVSSGKIEVGTEQWFKMTQAVEDTKDEIMKCTTNVEDFQNKINELHWKQFDKFIDRLEGLDSEISNITDILSKKDLVEEDTGEWTNEGLTSLAMYGEAYELAIFRAQQYSQEIQNLSDAYQRGEYSTLEYQEKLQELQDKQWDSIKASQAAKEGIIELNKTRVDVIKKGIEKEISATEELINKKKEALDIEKDAHDFQNTVAEKQEEIYKLQKQLNGLSADDSQEAAAKKKKIQSQLTDKQKELDEIYYDESVDQQKAALDTELENYKADQENKITLLEESLTNEEELIKTSLQTVQDNHTAVYDTLTQLGNEYGIKLSAAIVNPWTESSGALADFSSSFDEKKSHFTTELGNLGKDFEELGKKADETAQKILNMLNQIDQEYNPADTAPSSSGSETKKPSSSSGGGSSKKSKYQIVTNVGNKVELDENFQTLAEAKAWVEAATGKPFDEQKTYYVKKLAKGTRHASSGLALVNEQGTEAIFSKTPTGSFHLMNEGDQVFTKQQTDNLYRLSTAAPSLLLSAIASPALPETGASLQQHANSPANIDIKCPVYIQGSIDNQNIKKIQKQIDHSILKAVGQINQSMYKSGVRKV